MPASCASLSCAHPRTQPARAALRSRPRAAVVEERRVGRDFGNEAHERRHPKALYDVWRQGHAQSFIVAREFVRNMIRACREYLGTGPRVKGVEILLMTNHCVFIVGKGFIVWA